MIKLLLINILVMAMFALTHGNSEDPETKYLVVNPDKIDYKFTGKNDEHRFGVEVKENKQFHHTRTEEDGVRLGCYGYVHPNGKSYSTHYVADNRGYRIVPHQGEILVYPKDGSVARMASFFESFNEDEIKSSNIRYFFPNGCKSTMIDIKLVDPSVTPKPYVSPQFSSKTNGNAKTVPGVATNLNQDSKNFPTKIIPIVTGTVIQNKLNQNKDNKNSKDGINTNTNTVGNGSGSTGNSKLTSEKNTQESDNKTNGSDKNPANAKTNNDGNAKTNNGGNANNNNDGHANNNNDGNHNNNNDGNHNNNNDGNHNDNNDGRSNTNSDGNKSNEHTEPIYSRLTENSLNNQYLPTTEIEIEEPEKNEFLKIVSVTPSTPVIAVVPLKSILPVIPSNPSVPVSPLKPVTPVTSIKTSEPIVPVIPSKPIVSVTPLIPTNPIVPVVPTNPIVPANPSKLIVPANPSKPIVPANPSKPIVPANPSKPIVPVTPLAPSSPILPVSPPTKYPLNPIVPAVNVKNQCQDCCEDSQRPTLFMAKKSEATCCKKEVAKLSIPIPMDKLAKISMTELIEITSETNTITMLMKLLALAEKYQF